MNRFERFTAYTNSNTEKIYIYKCTKLWYENVFVSTHVAIRQQTYSNKTRDGITKLMQVLFKMIHDHLQPRITYFVLIKYSSNKRPWECSANAQRWCLMIISVSNSGNVDIQNDWLYSMSYKALKKVFKVQRARQLMETVGKEIFFTLWKSKWEEV